MVEYSGGETPTAVANVNEVIAHQVGAHVHPTVGPLVSLPIKILGHTADVELLVGNIHVSGMTDDVDEATTESGDADGRLRSLIPASAVWPCSIRCRCCIEGNFARFRQSSRQCSNGSRKKVRRIASVSQWFGLKNCRPVLSASACIGS